MITRLGDAAVTEVQTSQVLAHAASLAVVGAGGAFTGWVAGGHARGAAIGALVHLALFGAATAIVTPGGARAAYVGLSLVSGLGAGYLAWNRRRTR